MWTENIRCVFRVTRPCSNSSGVVQTGPQVNTSILLTKREGRTGRILARGLDSADRVQRGPYKKDRGLIFSQYVPEQAWLIRDLLHD